MSNFNEFFKSTGAALMVERFHDGVDGWSKNHKITNLRFKIEDDEPHPSSYYVENGLTAAHRVVITYDLDNDGVDRYSEFEVPMEIDGVFILEGSYRVSTNKLGNDYDCRMRLTGVGEHIVNFDYDRQYSVDKKVLKIKRINNKLGIPEKSLEIPYELIDETLDDPLRRELLRLTPKQIKKFQIKLDIDYVPEFITRKLIDDSIAFGDDRDLDLIIDKSIDSVAQGFMQYLFRDNNGRNCRSVRNRIMTYFSKWGKLQEQSNGITSLCFRFWKGNSGSTSKEIVVPPGVNAINLESLKSKITIPDTVAYNESMSDLIDIADTPINQNTNLQNSLNACVHLTDTAVLFDVYDKNFQKITIDYLDYLNSKVVASEYVNYETNTLKPTEEGKIEVKHRMKRKWVNKDDFDLIDLHPDYRLSETTRQIPFLNATDSVRISMGTSMLKQSIPLANAQRPLVGTGNYEELKNNVLNSRFKYPEGKVVEINPDDIIISVKGEDKEIKIPRRTALQSLNDVAVFTEPKVKVGDIVHEGDVISGAHEITKDSVNVGLNTLVLYSAYKGLVHEDAVVVSESYSDRMSSYGFIDIQIDIKTSSALKWIAPIGTKVKSREPVVTLYKAIKLDTINQILHDKLGPVYKDDDGKGIEEYTREQYLTVPNNIEEAIVSDVLIQENIKPVIPKNIKTPDYTWAKSSSKEIKKYEESKDRKPIYDRFPEYIASDTLDPIEMDPKEYKTVYTIRVRLIKITRLLVGSKLTNRYGGKGVISAILPDSEMPLVDGKPCELIMNPYSTINRKIPSVIMECFLGNVAVKIHDLVDQYKKTATGRKKIMPLLKKYYPGRYDDLSVEEFINIHNNKPLEEVYYFNVGCYSNYTPEKVQKMMDDVGVKSSSEVLMPETDLTDLEELKSELDPEEYQKVVDGMKGKFKKVGKPLMAGYITMEQLYHIPSYSNKVTSDMITNTRNAVPIAPRGAIRSTGQVIGELELSALISRGANKFIKNYRKSSEKELNQKFIDNLLSLGLMIVDQNGYAQGGSALKSRVDEMKKKYGRNRGGKGVSNVGI